MYKKLYPLKFNPVVLDKAWGSESWEISSMGDGLEGTVENGFLAENTLSDILETYMGELVGDNIFEFFNLQFPVLIKFLQVRDRLSVQVHPDDATALERYGDYGKNECWYIMEADSAARIHMGFKRPVTAAEVYSGCKDGTIVELLNEYIPHKGEFFWIPAGTVHACRGNLLIAEVQQPSDISLRLYDWGRENDPSTAREMHLEEALDCIDYSAFDDKANHIARMDDISTLVRDSHFSVTRMKLSSPAGVSMENSNSFIAYICTDGSAEIASDGGETFTIARKETILVPASFDNFTIRPAKGGVSLLQVHVDRIEEKDTYINDTDNGQNKD